MPLTNLTTLPAAMARLVPDGAVVALEGFTHLIPHAAGHELIRQGRRDLTIVRLTPDIVSDQLIGAGCVSDLVFSWGGNPGVGSLHRLRDAVEHCWPRPLRLHEHTHAELAARYVAGAAGLPFGLLRFAGHTDLYGVSPDVALVTCPFTSETVRAVRALRPDVTVIHAQRADRAGNVQLWGILGAQREAVLAARSAIATVEEVVDELEPRPGAVVLPHWTLTAVCEAPGGAHPSYASGYSERDNDYYRAWDDVSRTRESFQAWLDGQVASGTLQVDAT